MQDPTPLDPPEQELAEALASLALAPTGIPADSLWYQATAAREHRRANRWRAAAAVAVLAAGGAILWRAKPVTVTVDRVVVVREQETSPAAAPAPQARVASSDWEAGPEAVASAAYLRLRNRVLRDGLESLPASAGGEGDAATSLRAGSLAGGAIGLPFAPRRDHTFIRGG